jgi:hypothetical protein
MKAFIQSFLTFQQMKDMLYISFMNNTLKLAARVRPEGGGALPRPQYHRFGARPSSRPGARVRPWAVGIGEALSVELALSALILGPIFTNLPWREYFSHPDLLRYFGNIVGLSAYHLPGVFETNRAPEIIDANLWTLPAEAGRFHGL